MSDDTPTERFTAPEPAGTEPAGTEPAATERMPVAQGPTPPVTPPAPTEVLYTPTAAAAPTVPPVNRAGQAPAGTQDSTSRRMLYTLIAVGAALLIAVVIVVVMLLNRGDGEPVAVPSGSPSPSASPSASPSPSATPSATPSEEPEPETPVVVGPTFDSFTAPQTAGCEEGDATKPLTFSWSSSNATTAYIGVAVTNAKTGFYEGNLPPVYTYTGLEYTCNEPTQVYTVTLEDADGNLAHQTVTIAK